jgi:hypothetical protein
MDCCFIDRVFPSLSEVDSYQKMDNDQELLRKISYIVDRHRPQFFPNPFDYNNRELLSASSVFWKECLGELAVSATDIAKIYWGILCPNISKKPLDRCMKERIMKIWRKDHTVAGIAKTLYENNNRATAQNRFYEKKHMYTPLHEIQTILEREGVEIWSNEEVDLLTSETLAYVGTHPSSSRRKGFLSLQEFVLISQSPELKDVKKTPEQMMNQWNQRSSIWLIGHVIRPADRVLLESLYFSCSSWEELSEKFAERIGGEYYPDSVIQNFYRKQSVIDTDFLDGF